MPVLTLPTTGTLARSAFPERADKPLSAPDQWATGIVARLQRLVRPPAAREVATLARRLAQDAPALAQLDDATLMQHLRQQAPAAIRDLHTPALHDVLLLVGEASRRSLGMRPHATQLTGAATLLRGRLAEMQTGEGKTLTAGLAACLAAVAGVPTHVVTVNDYLAKRDADKNGALYRFAGLSVGVVVHGMAPDAKRAAYACDITYCTNKDIVFDYLRDRVDAQGRASAAQLSVRRLLSGGQGGQPLLRGLHFAIVDEADSILIDEARTPLILAEKAGAVAHAEHFADALEMARGLTPETHYRIDAVHKELHLTPEGQSHIARLSADRDGVWRSAQARESMLSQALRALHLFHRDRHYLIDPHGEVQIIDEYTGRVLPGRTWEQGLHQMIETKEGTKLSEQTRTLASITYQRFFARYLRLGGMSGTAREVAGELRLVYGLDTVTIPTHKPNRRQRDPDMLCADERSKWARVAERAAALQQSGQPVLIGTRSVEASERLSAELHRRSIPHEVLNARQDAEEADIVGRAGRVGAITVATNMAGRGTDIGLEDEAHALGGLFVILTEYHDSPRIDRQLIGRCARQGDPGRCQAIVALDDELFAQHAGQARALLRLAQGTPAHGWPGRMAQQALKLALTLSQSRAERMHARTRRETLRRDHQLDKTLAFSGDPI
ncbi:MAG: hypothetical protein QM742_03840 [Aquabacterium sp.]